MFRHSLLLTFAALILMASTCERPVDLTVEEPDPMLVVVSNFSDQRVLQVQVSKNIDALNGANIEYVRDANVELFEEDQFIERLNLIDPEDKPPFYTTYELKPKVGVRYTIRVEVANFKTIIAQSSIPPQIQIQNIEASNVSIIHGSDNIKDYEYDISLSFIDPARSKNFYHLKFYQQIHKFELRMQERFITHSALKEISFSPVNDNNDQLAYFRGGVLFADGLLDGQSISYSFPLRSSIRSDNELLGKVYAELRAVSEEYYLYHSSLSRQRGNLGVPFTEPVIVYDNIENGQGIFAGYSASLDSTSIIR